MLHDTPDATPGQAQLPSFLIGSIEYEEKLERGCPAAKTLHGFSRRLKLWCVMSLPCKRWGCRWCGERKITRFGFRCAAADPTRLLTLTVDNKLWSTPRAAFDGTKSEVSNLAVKLRKRFGEFEYFKVLEVTKKGWPHYHLIVRSDYIPQPVISDEWSKLTGAVIVDVRKIKKSADVFFYVVKYLGKQHYIPWTNRRVSWSRCFFVDDDFVPPPPLDLVEKTIIDDHPFTVIRLHYRPFRIQELSPSCWCFDAENGCRID